MTAETSTPDGDATSKLPRIGSDLAAELQKAEAAYTEPALDTTAPVLEPGAAGGAAHRAQVALKLTPARALGAAILVFLALTGWSAGAYITKPGTDSLAARLSGWARDHYLGFVVNDLEKLQYDLHKPKTGGAPPSIPIVAGAKPTIKPVTVTPPPARIPSQAGRWLHDEGMWQGLVTDSHGNVVVRSAFVRPDAEHTSYLCAVAWMDQRHLRFELHPGTSEPGGSGWKAASSITPDQYPGLVAAFNSGFKLSGARGGYYSEGREARPLRIGAASFVIYRDGHVQIGAWGQQVRMSPDVVSVRQNLDLLVDNGQLAPTVDENNTATWGFTLGNKSFVWRSGVGITRTGALVYAAGNAMSVRTIGQVLKAAGAVRAMELDINPDWTTYYWFEHPAGGGIVPHKLAQDMQKPVDRYLHVSSRDFFVVRER